MRDGTLPLNHEPLPRLELAPRALAALPSGMRTVVVKAAVATILLGSLAAHAEPMIDPCACSPNKPGFYRKGALTGDWGGEREQLRDDGITIAGTYASELFSAPGTVDKPVVAGLGVLAIDLDLSTLAHAGLGALHVSGLGIHGEGLSARLMDVYGVSNNVADSGVRLFEAWLEQPAGPLAIRAGLLSADQQFVLADHSTALINATFGIISMFSFNVLGPVYPVATPGVTVTYDGPIGVHVGIYDGDQPNDHGIPTELGGDRLAIGEVELADLLKLGAWHHTVLGNGYYAIADRRLERHVGAFARVSASPDNPVDLYIDTGVRIGPGPLRPHDFASVGLAFAHTMMGPQTVVEATYQLQLGWLTIQPDFQLLFQREHTAAILAVRTVVVL